MKIQKVEIECRTCEGDGGVPASHCKCLQCYDSCPDCHGLGYKIYHIITVSGEIDDREET